MKLPNNFEEHPFVLKIRMNKTIYMYITQNKITYKRRAI